ncbi:MAG: hypothetical protein KDI64_12740, partial [Candidatus Accumulibacter sp.]|nr:hypothetical protein [Accumulibacter sp.]
MSISAASCLTLSMNWSSGMAGVGFMRYRQARRRRPLRAATALDGLKHAAGVLHLASGRIVEP